MAKRFNLTGTSTLLAADQLRVKNLHMQAKARLSPQPLSADAVINAPLDNRAVSYIAQVAVGNPSTSYDLIVDTGSSNTWVGAGRPFVRTSTTVQTRDRVAVDYGSGFVRGTEFLDTVTLAPGTTIAGQSIGVASSSGGFEGVDGILGLGPRDLTLGTLSPDTTQTIPTVVDNLFAQGVITSAVLAISFQPTQSLEIVNGEATYGGTDPSKFIGSISFAPITSTSPSNLFWGIDQSIRYGSSTNILSNTAGIVDTGTTLTLIATDAFARYQRATGAVLDSNTGLLRLTPAQFDNLQSLFFTVHGVTFEFIPDAQIWPRSLNTAIGGNTNSVYLIIGDIGTQSGQGLDFIDGLTFLERFYAVFDTGNRRVGLANTENTGGGFLR
ncbi:aspartic peptidase A1 [Earliella scabrosa]|nr:aspartic peptidase A1 [Earliella scabrosa]